tara:strand:- start:1220 stop:2116 length:897 start_codon:yes stop_codon:yes gene_type:complete
MLQKSDPRNKNILININGSLIPRNKAGISPFDSSVQGGDAVWEGLRVYNGKIFRLKEHLDRLINSAKAISFSSIPSIDELRNEIKKTLIENKMDNDVHIRLTLTRGEKITSGMDPRLNKSGPTLIILPEYKLPVYQTKGITLISSSIRRFRSDMLDPKIHHNNLLQSILAKIEANASGADDALMLDDRGFIAETNATNLFFIFNKTVTTSHPIACPNGITRQSVLTLCKKLDIDHEEKDISQAEAYTACECFCTGTMGELAPVTAIDGRVIGDGLPGGTTKKLLAKFHELVISESEII